MKIRLRDGMQMFKTQEADLRLSASMANFCNFSEMGAGKSLPSALLAAGCLDDNIVDYVIIITPKAVLDDWAEIFTKFVDVPKDWVTLYHAPAVVRPFIIWRKIIICTYDTLMADYARFFDCCSKKRVMLIADEAQKLKNTGMRTKKGITGSKRTVLITELSRYCKRIHLLTGSPITNFCKNAYSYIDIMAPNVYYSSYKQFELQHFIYSKFDKRKVIGYRNIEKIQKILASFSVRHLKREVVELPPVTFKTRYLDWDPVQKKMYQKLMDDGLLELADRFIEPLGPGALLTRLHQITTNPQQLGLECDSTRFAVLEDDLEEIDTDEHKVVVWCHYRHTIERLLKQYAHLNPAHIYGGTGDIAAQKAKFRDDPTCRIIFANPQSGGLGLTFVHSWYMIFFEYAWDLEYYDQAISRSDRPGQQNPVTVINYALRGGMEHKKILPRLIAKKDFSSMILMDKTEFIQFITPEDDELCY